MLTAADGWLAIHKPAGLSVHNAPSHDLSALARRRIETDRALGRIVNMDASWGVHAVHRLDRDTSGIVLLATRAEAFTALSGQFADRRVRKRYLAVVHGRVEGSAIETWAWPLSAKAGGRHRPEGVGKQRPSRTVYRVEGLAERYSLLSCEPVSGRQHQIRRHAKLSGHPVVGDRRYGSQRALRYLQSAYADGKVRLALHGWQLRFVPPQMPAGKPLTLTAEPVPAFMQRLMGGIDASLLEERGW